LIYLNCNRSTTHSVLCDLQYLTYMFRGDIDVSFMDIIIISCSCYGLVDKVLITMFTSFDTKNRTNYDRKFINKNGEIICND